jgi:glycosyltransferase involved in cell wall biosynthesis
MKDMLENPKCGLLVDPLNSKEISDAVIELLQNNELNKNLGMAARQKVFNEYNSYKIGSLMETCYGQLSRTANLNALH